MESIITKSLELQRQAHRLLFIEDDAPIYSDMFCKQNTDVLILSDALYALWKNADALSPVEEAEVCLALLMGYNATIYNYGNKQTHIQCVLDRCWKILEQLPASLLKCRLLVVCYGEVFDEGLAKEAHTIIDSWQDQKLTDIEQETIDILRCMEEHPYPHWELEE